jgi:glycosyltransferase involved in cell wall biosynthesis
MSNQPTVALAMIVKGTKDEAEYLRKALASVNGYVDGIFLNINSPNKKVSKEVLDVAKQFGVIYEITKWTGNFVESRKTSFAMVPEEYDWILWLDADDTIDKPGAIKQVVEVASKQQQGIYVKYDYDHDEYGNTTVTHWVARIVRNNGSYEWRSSIEDEGVAVHETLNEVIPRPKALSEDFKVIHHADPSRRADSLQRNIKLLKGMYQKQTLKGELDPRTLFYLATHYYDDGQYTSAVTLLQDYLSLSGWKEERCEARVYLGNILKRFERRSDAKQEYLMAIGEFQNSPRPYIELSRLEYEERDFEESLGWIEKCLNLPKPTTTMVLRPMESSFEAYLLGAQAAVNIGGKKLEAANDYVNKALKLRSSDPDAKKAQDMVETLINKRDDIRAALRLVRKYEDEKKQASKILSLIDSLPEDVQDNPLILNVRHQYTEPKKWAKKSIAIYVGQGPLGIWGPWSLEEGIGGSEEAVIQLSRTLSDLGWNVTIYATPGEHAGEDYWEGKKTGSVMWKQYYEFNPKDEYDVIIAWRNPMFFDANFTARKKYLWLHDLMDKAEFLPERIANLDKVIFVGQYHADYYEGIIPKDKQLVSGNGIVPEEFGSVAGDRQSHRMVYMSAYNRGLKILLDNWNKIRTAVPDATLDVYYGWQSYDAINGSNPERMKWKDDLVKQIDEAKGVTDHGRVSHRQIIEELQTADLLAYPSIFPEVYCITYVKALAAGCLPVSSDYAQLGYYDQGIQIHYDQGELHPFVDNYTDELIKTLKRGVPVKTREEISEQAKQTYSWKQIANQWTKEMS